VKKKAFLLLTCAAVFGACSEPLSPAAAHKPQSAPAHDQVTGDTATQRGGNLMGSGN
jgi:hypothetical protein